MGHNRAVPVLHEETMDLSNGVAQTIYPIPETTMSEFIPNAQSFWNAIAPHTQQRLLENVWCAHCREQTTIVDFSGRIERGNLLLLGRCATCGGNVARVIEGPDA
ncbi:hypothetical protein [Chromobacterium sp. Panama]|uniref:hypothetical protein n=1 Tax=Chromobacterium sp. Panama TaxID=2161826 RepID=UPI0011B28342|nr:hypothetical protein [Chromobacterium sp. Panama]